MSVLESPDYQAARDRLKGHPIVSMMAAGVVTVPLAELAHQDGTPRSRLMHQANHAFDDAEARNKANPAYQPYPAGRAQAPRPDRRGRPSRARGDARGGRLRYGRPRHPPGVRRSDRGHRAAAGQRQALQIARQTGAIAGPGPGPLPPPAPAESGGAASGEPEQGVI